LPKPRHRWKNNKIQSGEKLTEGLDLINLAYRTGRWIMPRIVTVILIYHRHKPIDSINVLGS
jgi:hypothetical protein